MHLADAFMPATRQALWSLIVAYAVKTHAAVRKK